MKHHVLPGDSLIGAFRETDIEGEMIVCRECLIEGDLKSADLEEFWLIRENYLQNKYPHEEDFYRRNVKSELEKLRMMKPGDEVHLWFEHELFCQANLWFCLALLSETNAKVFRIAPVVDEENEIWKGFGELSQTRLERSYRQRIELSRSDLKFGCELWNAFQNRKFDDLLRLAAKKNEKFPYLPEVCRAASEIDTRPPKKIAELIDEGETDFEGVFRKFKETEAIYGFGDLQIKSIYDRLIEKI